MRNPLPGVKGTLQGGSISLLPRAGGGAVACVTVPLAKDDPPGVV